jgi:hypothetical protein
VDALQLVLGGSCCISYRHQQQPQQALLYSVEYTHLQLLSYTVEPHSCSCALSAAQAQLEAVDQLAPIAKELDCSLAQVGAQTAPWPAVASLSGIVHHQHRLFQSDATWHV